MASAQSYKITLNNNQTEFKVLRGCSWHTGGDSRKIKNRLKQITCNIF